MMPEAMDKPRVVVLTGAGISAESGIQTFRAADGLWEEHRVEDVATPEGFARDPALVQAFYGAPAVASFSSRSAPNAAHLALAKAGGSAGGSFSAGHAEHRQSSRGRKPQLIIHMHGELLKVRCAWSGQVLDWKEDVLDEDRCHCCPVPFASASAWVWFGEMPLGMDEIYSALALADVLYRHWYFGTCLSGGGICSRARLQGAHTVELNLEPSQVGSEFEEKHYGLASEGGASLCG